MNRCLNTSEPYSNEKEDERILWCGNIHDDVTEEILFELFLQAGPLSKVKIIPPKDGKQSYAFITFEHRVSVAYAKELLSNVKLFGKPLKLQLRNKAQSSSADKNFKEHIHLNETLKHAYLSAEHEKQLALAAHTQTMPHGYPYNYSYNSWSSATPNFNQQQWNTLTTNFNYTSNLYNYPGHFK